MQNKFDKYLDGQLDLCFLWWIFATGWQRKKGGLQLLQMNVLGENGPKLQYSKEKHLKSLILTQVLVCHQSSEVPKNFYFRLWPLVTNFG